MIPYGPVRSGRNGTDCQRGGGWLKGPAQCKDPRTLPGCGDPAVGNTVRVYQPAESIGQPGVMARRLPVPHY